MTCTNIVAPGFSLGLHLRHKKPEPKFIIEVVVVRRLASLKIRATPAKRPELYKNQDLRLLSTALVPGLKSGANIEFIIPFNILISAIATTLVELMLFKKMI